MKTGTLNCTTFALFVTSLSVIFIGSFAKEHVPRRGCDAYGHACYGGHGKRSAPDLQNPSLEAGPVRLNDEAWISCDEMLRQAQDNQDIQQLQAYNTKCRHHTVKFPRNTESRPNAVALLINLLALNRRPYKAYSETSDK